VAAQLRLAAQLYREWTPVLFLHGGQCYPGVVHRPFAEKPYLVQVRAADRILDPAMARAVRRAAGLGVVRVEPGMDLTRIRQAALVGGRLMALGGEDTLYAAVRPRCSNRRSMQTA
jgi:hypothetical protein